MKQNSLLGNQLTGKGIVSADEGTINGVYSKNNSPKLKDGTYAINLDEFKSRGTHWTALYVNGNNIVYFNRFGVGHIPK